MAKTKEEKENWRVDPTSKPVKYFEGIMQGKTKSQAEKEAYGVCSNRSSSIEKTKQFRAVSRRYLMEKENAYTILNDNIKQRKDIGGSNRALDMYFKLSKLYPTETSEIDDGDINITIRKK